VRDSRVEDDRLILAGVANAMPCTVEIGGKELLRLAGKLMRPAVIGLALRALFSKAD
jgi:hypothetical protein